jgi:hypothetical protein
MVSSTFTDLEEHRDILLKAINGQALKAIAMEYDSAKPDVDVIDSSLRMVCDASAYIGLISRKYGQTPACLHRNPTKLSITELEFNEALRLKRPILLFIMAANHPVREADVETNAGKRRKLNAFRERAKRKDEDSQVPRVYATFQSLDDFTKKAYQSVAELRRFLDECAAPIAEPNTTRTQRTGTGSTHPVQGHLSRIALARTRKLLIAVLSIPLAVILALYLSAEPEVKITPVPTMPINDASFVAQGTSRHVWFGKSIWIALRSIKSGKYYLHFNHTQLALDGHWSTSHAVLSVAQVDEEDFELIALVVDRRTASVLRDYLRNPLRSPLNELPAGANPACAVRVKIAHPLQGYTGGIRLAENIPGSDGNIPAEVDQYVPVIFAGEQPASDQELWVVVYSDSPRIYFPQPCVKTATYAQDQPCKIEVGAASDFGVEFQILIVQADRGAQSVLNDYIGRVDRAGVPGLPPDTRILRSFTVHRKKANLEEK